MTNTLDPERFSSIVAPRADISAIASAQLTLELVGRANIRPSVLWCLRFNLQAISYYDIKLQKLNATTSATKIWMVRRALAS